MLPSIPYRYRVLALLCSLTTLTYLDRICISIVGVRIKSETMSSLGGYLLLFLSSMRSSKFLPALGRWYCTESIIYSHCFILVPLYCLNRFGHRACLTHHYSFPVWNGRIRHLPQLHDCSFPLVSPALRGVPQVTYGGK